MSSSYNQKFSQSEIEKYKLEYGVKIVQKDNKTFFSGSNHNIDVVKSIIDRNNFLDNNKPRSNYTLKKDSFVHGLDNLKYKPNYSSSNQRDNFVSREFEWL